MNDSAIDVDLHRWIYLEYCWAYVFLSDQDKSYNFNAVDPTNFTLNKPVPWLFLYSYTFILFRMCDGGLMVSFNETTYTSFMKEEVDR